MAFATTSRNIRLEGAVLKALCANKEGRYVSEASFNLDKVLGNINGRFLWGAHAFSESGRSVHLVEAVLHAELRTAGGNEWKKAEFDLNKVIANRNGELVPLGLPAAITVPDGAPAQLAIEQLYNALGANKKYKIYTAKGESDSSIWHIDASAEGKADIFFKAFDYDTTMAFYRIVEARDRKINEIPEAEVSAQGGATASYVEVKGLAVKPYTGKLPTFKADPSHFDLKNGTGKVHRTLEGSLDKRLPGCTLTIVKQVSMYPVGNEIHINFGKFFE